MQRAEVHNGMVTVSFGNGERVAFLQADDSGQAGRSAPQDDTEMRDAEMNEYGSDEGDDSVHHDNHDDADEAGEMDENENEDQDDSEEQQLAPSTSQSDAEAVDNHLSDNQLSEDEEDEGDDADEANEDDISFPPTQSGGASTTASQQPAYIQLPPLPTDLKIPEPTKHKGESAHRWKNLSNFEHIDSVQLLSGALHPNGLCGTLMLDRLVKQFTHSQLEDRINELYALVDGEKKKKPLSSSAITKRWTVLLKERYPDQTEYNNKKQEIKDFRKTIRVAPRFSVTTPSPATTPSSITSAPATPGESPATCEDHIMEDQEDESIDIVSESGGQITAVKEGNEPDSPAQAQQIDVIQADNNVKIVRAASTNNATLTTNTTTNTINATNTANSLPQGQPSISIAANLSAARKARIIFLEGRIARKSARIATDIASISSDNAEAAELRQLERKSS